MLAAHVDGIDGGGGELIELRVAARDDGGGDEGHAAADHVYRDDVETFAFVGGKLAEICAEQIGERRGSVDAFVPAGEGRSLGAFDDRRADDRDGQVACRVSKASIRRDFL